MAEKKISFGFSKIAKKINLQAGPAASTAGASSSRGKDEKIEMISCLEGQSIKIIGKENGDEEAAPLVIPLRDQDKTTIPVRLAKLQQINEDRKVPHVGEETLEQKAARELLAAAHDHKNRAVEKNNIVIPLKPEDLPLEGGQMSSLADYEAMPPEKFGLALLRGMGFKDDPNAPKKEDKLPDVRPKGMGLGAERIPKDKNRQLIPPAKDEVLVMGKGAFVRVLAGKHKESYGRVESLNEDTSRVLVCFALGGNQESLNEYLLQLVSKAEYSKYSKVLNNAKYEEFKYRSATTGVAVKQEERDERKIKREPSDSPPPKPQASCSNRTNTVDHKQQQQHKNRSRHSSRSPSRSDHNNRRDRRDDRRDDRDSRTSNNRHDHRDRHTRRDLSDADESTDGSVNDRDRNRHHHHRHQKASSYGRTSSGTKKKSHKYKQRRDHSRERKVAHSSDEDDRHHKKKTKKSKKQRSRSRSRR
ncbi:G-patch domain and KOW motifs-containing protein [Topomyia yanbarensis]|uniref:G-patch domain and KOW motifs-containing protein n=1 Tax=Topomyia yanbarensis TaxID=2498891 RepID=UPI00273B7CF6|nr:G-patch domain and KOW motifs-containing protein [Topomyia yanbarensis]